MFTLNSASGVLEALTGKDSSVSIAPTCYIGFSTTEPALNGTGYTEPSPDAGYERILGGNYNQDLTQLFGTPYVDDDNNVAITNSTAIKSNRATGSWGTITHILFFNARVNGNLIAFQALTSPITVSTGESIQIDKGALKLTLK